MLSCTHGSIDVVRLSSKDKLQEGDFCSCVTVIKLLCLSSKLRSLKSPLSNYVRRFGVNENAVPKVQQRFR
jgi:hypothetical protein